MSSNGGLQGEQETEVSSQASAKVSAPGDRQQDDLPGPPKDLSGLSDGELDTQIAAMERTKTEETISEERRQKERKLRDLQMELAGMRVTAKQLTLEAAISESAMSGAVQGVTGCGDTLLQPETPKGTGIIPQSRETSNSVSEKSGEPF